MPSKIMQNEKRYKWLLDNPQILCGHCNQSFGEHCTADDACPYPPYIDQNGHEYHGGFNRSKVFTIEA